METKIKLDESEVTRLLQGQWFMNFFSLSFYIIENEIVDIFGFKGVEVEKVSYKLSWNEDTEHWMISVPEFGWNNVPIIELTEKRFFLFEAIIDGRQKTVDGVDLVFSRG